jgi:hypothetical protein
MLWENIPGMGHIGIVEGPLEAVLLWMVLDTVEGRVLLRCYGKLYLVWAILG